MSSGQTIFEEECLRCARRSDAYREAFYASEDALLLLSSEVRILDANPAMADCCQYRCEEILALTFETLFPRKSDYKLALAPERLTANRPLFTFSTILLTRHRRDIPVTVAVSALPASSEAAPVFQANITAVGADSPAAETPGETGGRTMTTGPRVAAARSGLWPDGRYLETDPVLETMLGYTGQELSALNTLTLLAEPDIRTHLENAVNSHPVVREPELVLRHSKGHTLQVAYMARKVIQPETGKPALDEVFLETIPASQIEAACQTADRLRAIGALAGGIAHNFNNILTGIYGNITLARMELTEQTNAMHHLEKAEDSMEEAVKLTRQLLTFAKGGDPVKETFDPGPLIEEVVRFNLSGSTVKPVLNIRKGLWPVHGDRDQISQVITNIIINARQAMPEGGTLDVAADNSALLKDNLLTIARGAYIKLSVRDNGTGIAQQDLERIFDPYFSTRPDGSGMGLSICYSIVTKHKGHIAATSQLGSGTAVTVYLPAVPDEPSKEETKMSEKPQATPRARILVMDDEAHIRTITRKMLEKFGYSVTMTEDGEAAVTAYAQAMEAGSPFDMVIMDLTIPGGMGGQEASRIILDMDPEAVIVVSSGYSNDKVMADYKAYGLKGIIPKPFRLAELKTTIENLIAK